MLKSASILMERANVITEAINAVQRMALWRFRGRNRMIKTPTMGKKVTRLRIENKEVIAVPQRDLSK